MESQNLSLVYYFPLSIFAVGSAFVLMILLWQVNLVSIGFWRVLAKQVELEPFAPLTRIFGRNHRSVLWQGKRALALETPDFAKQCIELCETLSGTAAKLQSTSHMDSATLPESGNESRGQLSDSAARILMKILWLSRFVRPDIVFAVTFLATHAMFGVGARTMTVELPI